MKLEDILKKYDQKETRLQFEKAEEIMTLLSDSDLYNIYQKHNNLFSKLSQPGIGNKKEIEKAIEIFIEYIQTKNLSEDEFDVMTEDDILEYIRKVAGDLHSDLILKLIRTLENDTRNKTNKSSLD